MVFESFHPSGPLGNFVDTIIYSEGYKPEHRLDRFLPDGNSEIIIDLNDEPQYVYDNSSLEIIQVCKVGWVSGVRTKPITIPSGNGSRMIIITFKKGGAHPFYSLPMNEISDSIIMADSIFGKQFLLLRELLLYSKTVPEMFQQTVNFLINLAGKVLNLNSESNCIYYALAEITIHPEIINFKKLSTRIGYSQKHFINLFKKQVGVSPKQYFTIMRFQKVVKEIENSNQLNWSQIAAESGYYDQAHFINEFKRFSGFTPREYMEKKTAALTYIPVG